MPLCVGQCGSATWHNRPPRWCLRLAHCGTSVSLKELESEKPIKTRKPQNKTPKKTTQKNRKIKKPKNHVTHLSHLIVNLNLNVNLNITPLSGSCSPRWAGCCSGTTSEPPRELSSLSRSLPAPITSPMTSATTSSPTAPPVGNTERGWLPLVWRGRTRCYPAPPGPTYPPSKPGWWYDNPSHLIPLK